MTTAIARSVHQLGHIHHQGEKPVAHINTTEQKKQKVVVGLSGGVDSSVAAASLQNQGYDVVGMTLWLMKGKGQCCSEGMVDAAAICEQRVEMHMQNDRINNDM